jgi:ADP-ribose diphosphatase
MYKIISSKEVFSHPRLSLVEDEVILPSGVKTNYLKYKDDGKSAVTIIVKRNDGKILLQKKYFYPPNQTLYQFPGGIVPQNEKIEGGANRELMEEAGLMSKNLELLGSYFLYIRRATTKMFVYLATDLENKYLAPDQEEEIESFWFSEDEIAEMIKNDEIINSFVLSAWCLYKMKK